VPKQLKIDSEGKRQRGSGVAQTTKRVDEEAVACSYIRICMELRICNARVMGKEKDSGVS